MDSNLPPLPLPVSIPTTTNGNHHHHSPSPVPPPPPPPLNSQPTASNLLEQELPNVTNDLISLSYLIDRLITQSYSDLSTLLETLPSSTDQQRKQSLVDYVLQFRRQFLKLLVLTRWSKESEKVKKSFNLIGYLTDQNRGFDQTVDRLRDTVEGLKGARVRNYDLETSLIVLKTGDYSLLPSNIREAFKGQEKLNDEEVLETMKQVEQVMRWRLKMGKVELPIQMKQNYTIKDGRVFFRIKGLWEASFVYSGSNPEAEAEAEAEGGEEDEAEWYLLGVKFLFKVKDDANTSWNPTPTGPLKQHLIELCNSQLARKPFLPPPPPPPAPPIDPSSSSTTTTEQDHSDSQSKYLQELKQIKRERNLDRNSLKRGFKFLTNLALSYQLESVYSQAVKLIRGSSSWNECGLRVEIDKEREMVKIEYWNDTGDHHNRSTTTKQQQVSTASTSSTTRFSPGGTLIFSSSSSSSSSPSSDQSIQNHPPLAATNDPLSSTSTSSKFHSDPKHVQTRRRKALEKLLQNRRTNHDSRNRSKVVSDSSTTLLGGEGEGEGKEVQKEVKEEEENLIDSLQITYLPSSSSTSSSSNPSSSSSSGISVPPDFIRDLLAETTTVGGGGGENDQDQETDRDIVVDNDGDEDEKLLLFDLEKVLTRLTKRHAEETIKVIARELGIHHQYQEVEEDEEKVERRGRIVYPRSGSRSISSSKSSNKGKAMQIDDNDNDKDSEEVEGEEEEGVPFILLPLVGNYSIRIEVDYKSGRIELKSSEEGGDNSNSSSSRENRLRSASDRLNSLRFSNSNPSEGGSGSGENWLKSLPEVVSKIKATTILDEVSTCFSLLSLPTLRRLPLPPRELFKFGSLPSLNLGRPTFLFVPLSSSSSSSSNSQTQTFSSSSSSSSSSCLQGFYLTVVVMEDFGIRFGLLETKEFNDLNSGNSWIEINEIGWIYDNREHHHEDEDGRGSKFGNDSVGTELLRKIYNFCVHRILVYRLEQQLYSRQIPYRSSTITTTTPYSASSDSGFAKTRLSIDLEPPPFLILDTQFLTRLPIFSSYKDPSKSTTIEKKKKKNVELSSSSPKRSVPCSSFLLMRTAALRCQVSDDGGGDVDSTGTIKTTLHVRFNPSLPTDSLPKPFSTLSTSTSTSMAKLPENVYYNPVTRTLVFLNENGEFGNSLENLLKAFNGVMKELLERIGEEEEEDRRRLTEREGR